MKSVLSFILVFISYSRLFSQQFERYKKLSDTLFYSETIFLVEEFEKAIEAWELMLLSYPNFADGYFAIIEAKIELKQDYSQYLEKLKTCLLTTEFYTEDELIELRQAVLKL